MSVAVLALFACSWLSSRSDWRHGWSADHYRDGSVKNWGDVLWAWMFYLIVLALRPRIAKPSAAVITLLVCAAIECFKLYHAPWVDAVRATRAGGLLLGHIFLLTNFVSYMLGTAIGLLADARITLPPPKSLPL